MSEGPQTSRIGDVDPAEQEPTGPTVRDHRRIDPETGTARPAQHAASGAPATGPDQAPQHAAAGDASSAPAGAADQSAVVDPQVAELKTALADRTADLQRVQAEYVNYKRRIDRDRDLARTGGIEAVLRELLTVLDNVSSARKHEEMSAGFRAVSDEIERVTGKHGLTSFGEAGDAFDPHVHEALMHSHATEVNGTPITGPTCVAILQPGYRINDKVIRPARVAVAEPDGEPAGSAGSAQSGESAGAGEVAGENVPPTAE